MEEEEFDGKEEDILADGMDDLDNRDNQAIVMFNAANGDDLLKGSALMESHLDLKGSLYFVPFVEGEPVTRGQKIWHGRVAKHVGQRIVQAKLEASASKPITRVVSCRKS